MCLYPVMDTDFGYFKKDWNGECRENGHGFEFYRITIVQQIWSTI